MSIGTYTFNAGTNGYVKLTRDDEDPNPTVVDGIKLMSPFCINENQSILILQVTTFLINNFFSTHINLLQFNYFHHLKDIQVLSRWKCIRLFLLQQDPALDYSNDYHFF